MMKLKAPYLALLLTFLVLVVYYPTIFAGFNSVDDMGMVSRLLNTEHFSVKNLFLPGGSGYYYRPLLGLTFIADKYLWGLLESFMHLENILLHALNAVLVFFIGITIFKKYDINNKLLPFSAALLFALHPVNTEAVNWISGRTDVLSGCFILFSVLFLLTALEKKSALFAVVASSSLFLGCLSKETAVFFFPAALFLIYGYDEGPGYSTVRRLKERFVPSILFAFSLAAYFLLRHLAFIKNDSGISTATKWVLTADADLFNSTRIFLKVMGFYVKKLFIPWPLNFGILNVSDYYIIIGVVLVAFIPYLLFYRRDLIAAVYFSGICTIVPAFLVAMGGMAWTRIAERYLYISSATFAIAITYTISVFIHAAGKRSYFIEVPISTNQVPASTVSDPHDREVITGNEYVRNRIQKISIVATAALFIMAAITTVQRNIVWQDNLTLFEDTVAKSPHFRPAKNELASALLHHGRTSEAFKLVRANAVSSIANTYMTADINKAKIMAAENDLEGARMLLLAKLDAPGKQYNEILKALIAIDDQRVKQTNSKTIKLEILTEQVDLLMKLYARTPEPFYHYRIGQIYLFMNKQDKARMYFEKAYAKAPDSAHYKLSAKKLAEKLKP